MNELVVTFPKEDGGRYMQNRKWTGSIERGTKVRLIKWV